MSQEAVDVGDLSVCGNAIMRLFKETLYRASDIGHKTAWAFTDLSNDDTRTKLFMIFTTNEERAQAIKFVLEREGLLCDTDLGDPGLGATPPGLTT